MRTTKLTQAITVKPLIVFRSSSVRNNYHVFLYKLTPENLVIHWRFQIVGSTFSFWKGIHSMWQQMVSPVQQKTDNANRSVLHLKKSWDHQRKQNNNKTWYFLPSNLVGAIIFPSWITVTHVTSGFSGRHIGGGLLACCWLTRSLCYLIKKYMYYYKKIFSLIKPLEHFKIFTFYIIEKNFLILKIGEI